LRPAFFVRVRRISSRLQLRQQAQDFQVQPHQGDDQAEARVPLHVLRRALFDALLDEVEVEHEVQRGDHHHEGADADRQPAAVVQEAEALAEEAAIRACHVDQEDRAGGGDHAELEVLGRLDQAAAVRREQREAACRR
jgi:hypothetical protein